MISEKRKPRVVALIPCYNTRPYIRAAVASLLNQTRPLDLIVVLDDCSTDGFEEEIQDLVKQNANLIIHRHPHNLGRSGCRNAGFEQFPADFYILNDADDISLPTRVEKSLAYMAEHPNCGVVAGFVNYIDTKGNITGKTTEWDLFTKEDSARYRNSLTPIGLNGSSVCLRGEIIHRDGLRFDVSLPACEDMELWNLILEKGWDVIVLPEILAQYRLHPNSIFTSRFVFCKTYDKYVTDRLIRRRRGQPPIDYETFMANVSRQSFCSKWRFYYPIYANYFYRTGGYHLIEKHYLRGLFMVGLSLLMQPSRFMRLVRQRFGKRF